MLNPPVQCEHRHAENIMQRLKRIEGQVRGLQKMMDEDRYCVDILVQISAASSAINQVGLSVLESHTRGCVTQALDHGVDGDEKMDELVKQIRQFIDDES
ncbi:metal-sensitive transcriptional regulator [Alicyclobacillus tolerans]|uniref:metal-sensitive transcriptional regulator n=1 Tax=Alicyclobacillus tolerans TaxID=90970 RepID=UPI001F3695F7|nr:metal-sensitive transcriptional regulator [Alicyclobacillus tolerans]MCF8568590.1 metal-sensitive transcriptional regulator [Alicyclobacillus tolerans]